MVAYLPVHAGQSVKCRLSSFSAAGVVKMYEARLKQVNPRQVHITYDITDLYGFIDELGDLSALV